jgi:DNA-binding XRE family transcriptional regulator
MGIDEKIKARREELGLSDVEVAKVIGLGIAWYGDIEDDPKEIVTTVELSKIKQLCEILRVHFFDLFDMKCAFCQENQQYLPEFSLSRNELLYRRRTIMGLSEEDLGDQINLYAWAVKKLEAEPNELETCILETLQDLSRVLDIPLQVVLNVKCGKCNR